MDHTDFDRQMDERIIDRCNHCGGNLNSGHCCSPWVSFVTDLKKEVKDIVALAKAVAQDNPTRYEPDCGPPQYYCQHCEAEVRGWDIKEEDFQHKPSCPVIIAKRYLK